MNVSDADAAVENPKDNFGVYKTATGSYIADTADLAVGAYADEPTLLVKQTISRGKTLTSLHDFRYTPTGAVTYAEGNGSVYYQDTKGNWFRDNFTKDGVFQETNSLTLSEVRNEEGVHDLDLDGDGVVGDTIESVLAKDGQSKAIFKTISGSYILDDSTLSVGNQTKDPTLLVTQKVYRGKTTISLKDFDYRPTGIVTNADGSNAVYYQDTKGNWFKESFSSTGVFTTQETYTLSQLFADESKYKNDLNNDSHIGGIISSVIADNQNFALYKIASGAYIKRQQWLGHWRLIGKSNIISKSNGLAWEDDH